MLSASAGPSRDVLAAPRPRDSRFGGGAGCKRVAIWLRTLCIGAVRGQRQRAARRARVCGARLRRWLYSAGARVHWGGAGRNLHAIVLPCDGGFLQHRA